MTLSWSLLALLLGLCLPGLYLPGIVRAESSSALRRADRASEIEQRLIAPCCWTQTLDVHDSELSTALRIEIRARLSAGETPTAIEDDLALRFGEKIRAVPRDGDVRGLLPLAIGVCMALSLLVLFRMARQGRMGALEAGAPAGQAVDASYDLALERELRRLDSDRDRAGLDRRSRSSD